MAVAGPRSNPESRKTIQGRPREIQRLARNRRSTRTNETGTAHRASGEATVRSSRSGRPGTEGSRKSVPIAGGNLQPTSAPFPTDDEKGVREQSRRGTQCPTPPSGAPREALWKDSEESVLVPRGGTRCRVVGDCDHGGRVRLRGKGATGKKRLPPYGLLEETCTALEEGRVRTPAENRSSVKPRSCRDIVRRPSAWSKTVMAAESPAHGQCRRPLPARCRDLEKRAGLLGDNSDPPRGPWTTSRICR